MGCLLNFKLPGQLLFTAPLLPPAHTWLQNTAMSPCSNFVAKPHYRRGFTALKLLPTPPANTFHHILDVVRSMSSIWRNALVGTSRDIITFFGCLLLFMLHFSCDYMLVFTIDMRVHLFIYNKFPFYTELRYDSLCSKYAYIRNETLSTPALSLPLWMYLGTFFSLQLIRLFH